MNKLLIIKIGGNVLDNEDALNTFCRDFASLDGPKILVHGGGKIATRIGEQLGIKPVYMKGRRITDAQTRDLVTMVYGGLINKQLVAKLQSVGCNAMGLTGADGNLILATKRPKREVDYGFVGDITVAGVNTEMIHVLLKQNIIPVVAPLTIGDGEILNTNADTIASTLAIALSTGVEVRLIFCFDKKGILRDSNDNGSVIRLINERTWKELLAEEALTDGILPKLENAFAAIDAGVKEVLIGEAADLIANTKEETSGTLIRKD